MDPTWKYFRNVERIAQETLLTVTNTLHKAVRTKLTPKLTAQVLIRNSFLQRMRAVKRIWIDTTIAIAVLTLSLKLLHLAASQLNSRNN